MFIFIKSLLELCKAATDLNTTATHTQSRSQANQFSDVSSDEGQARLREQTPMRTHRTSSDKQPTEAKPKPAPKPKAKKAKPEYSLKKHKDDRITEETAYVLGVVGLMHNFPNPSNFVDRWKKLDDLLRMHGVSTTDLHSALNLILLYRGSEPVKTREAKIKAWANEFEQDDGLESKYDEARGTVCGMQFGFNLYDWGVVKMRDAMARNLKKRAQFDVATLKPGTIASLPKELMEVNTELLACQAKELIERHNDIDLTDSSVQTMSFKDLRVYLDNRKLATLKRSGWSLTEVIAKSVKTKENASAPQPKPPAALPGKEVAKKARACRKLSLNCVQLWVSRELPCKSCKMKVIEPCIQCNQDIAASSCLLFYECSHLMHKNCVAASHYRENRCPECWKSFKSPPTQLN
jgi:hypothetical protein